MEKETVSVRLFKDAKDFQWEAENDLINSDMGKKLAFVIKHEKNDQKLKEYGDIAKKYFKLRYVKHSIYNRQVVERLLPMPNSVKEELYEDYYVCNEKIFKDNLKKQIYK